MLRSALASLALASSIVLAGLAGTAAQPLPLGDEAAMEQFATMVRDYADTTRVRWTVQPASPADEARLLAALTAALGERYAHLVDRVEFIGSGQATRSIGGAAGSVAFLTVSDPPPRPCSWRVSLTDPSVPTLDGSGKIPLERGDRLPSSADARIEVGFAGPLQSTLYAFGETTDGAIRDLAASTEIAIPVDASGSETLVLVRARRPVPYLDMIRTRLAETPGARADLGETYALAERFRNGGRGIGANIQLVDPGMIVAESTVPAASPTPAGADREIPVARMDELMETCVYQITPRG